MLKISKADNATIWDDTGKEYIDFTSGIFAANIGHANPYVTEAIKKALDSGIIHTYKNTTGLREEYIEALCEFTGFEAAALFSDGTVATEAAWRIMREYTGEERIFNYPGNFFHGKTLGALLMANRFEPHLNCGVVPDVFCGAIIETYDPLYVQFHNESRIHELKEIQNGAYICVDEIQAGFGRTGKLFGYEHYDGFKPDLVCIGKGMGNGFPISGVLGSKELIDNPKADLSCTHGGNPLACAAGLAVIKYMKEFKVIDRARKSGEFMQQILELMCDSLEFIKKVPITSQGKGMVAALILDNVQQADKLVQKAEELGLLLVRTGGRTVKLGPPLTIPSRQLAHGLEILKEAIRNTI